MEDDVEKDPLSTEFPFYENCITNIQETQPEDVTIKIEPLDYIENETNTKVNEEELNSLVNIIQEYPLIVEPVKELPQPETEDTALKNVNENHKENKSIKKKKRVRLNQVVSKEVEELQKAIPFYACAVCDIKYNNLNDLQKHVATHKDRMTSWDWRVKSKKVKKKLKKEKKKKKKSKTEVKKEEEIEIKQEIDEDSFNLANNEVNMVNGLVNDNGNTVNDNGNTVNDNGNLVNNSGNLDNVNGGENKCTEDTKSSNKENGKKAKVQEPVNNLERIFKCGGCGKQFSLGYYLKLHVRSHTGEKPYICQDCGLSFITASKLGRHRKRMHLLMRVICRICRRPYTRLEFLIRHFNKHHAAEKIVGEPYDYNTILPYLKELEEELQKKKEMEEAKVKSEAERLAKESIPFVDNKLDDFKLEDDFDWDAPLIKHKTPKPEDQPLKVKNEFKDEEIPVKIKEEDNDESKLTDSRVNPVNRAVNPTESDSKVNNDDDDWFNGDNGAMDDEPFKDNLSDDDHYLPDATWLPTAESPPKLKKKKVKRAVALDKDATLPCEVCKKEIKHTYMRIHVRTHTEERPYKCDICNKGFITASKMNRHLLTHMEWDEEKNEVKLEDDVIKQETDADGIKLEKDSSDSKKKSKKLKRKRKKRSLITSKIKREQIKEEIERRKQARPYGCDFCKKRFLYPEALQVHMRAHAGETKVYDCQFCLENYPDEDSLKLHESTHVGPRPYLCTICGRDYKKKESMIYHRRTHEVDKKFQCDICPKTFNAQFKLTRHFLSHRPDKFVVRYECPVCAHIFNTKYHIEMHLTTHEKEGVILPENRGQVIAMVMQNARKIPLETDSTANKPLPFPGDERSRICNICGDFFQHFYFLEQHLKTHGNDMNIEKTSEEKKHICSVCNKGFKLSYYLKLHSYTHTKEKPYICSQCGKGFITKGKLKRHMETHAGVKKYQCYVCYKFFTRPSYLRIHVRTIHGTQDYNFKMDMDYQNYNDCSSVVSNDSVVGMGE